MKTVLIIIFFLVISFPCFASLTQEDAFKIRQIIREEIEPLKLEMANIKSDIKAIESKVTTLDNRMATFENKIATLEGKMATKDDLLSIWKEITGKIEGLYGLLIGVLVAIIVSVILPPVLQKWFERRKMGNDVDELKQEIAKLKEKGIISP